MSRVLSLFLFLTAISPSAFAQDKLLSKTVTLIFQQSSFVGHELLDQALHRYVRNGLVDYAGLKKDVDFSTYLAQLERFNPDSLDSESENVRLAFWINVYNAYTMKLILDYYPVESIKDIGGGTRSPWSLPVADIGGTVYSLEDIERKIVTDFDEPRIHFAIVPGAKGSPILRSEAYIGSRLNEQLENATQAFLRDSSKNYLDKVNKKTYLSRVFEQHSKELGTKYGSVTKFIRQYFDGDDRKFLDRGNYGVVYRDFDWSLNGQ
jgi:hypothetical protein